MGHEDEIKQLVSKAYQYTDKHKYRLAIPLFEKAVNIAKENNDILNEMYCRFELIKAYVFSKKIMKAIINFSWCIDQMKKGCINDTITYNILWEYKYIVDDIYTFVSIPINKINEIFEDMKRMYIENGISLKPYYAARISAFIYGIDNGIDVKEYHKKWLLEPKDKYEDCTACVLNSNMNYYIFIKEYDRALKEAENILNGKYTCMDVPKTTFAELLLPVYSLGKYDLADTLHQKGIRLINGNKDYIKEIAQHIMYLSITNIEKSIEVFQTNYPNFLKSSKEDENLWFNTGAFVLFSKLQESNIKKIKIKVPTNAPIYLEDGYEVSALNEFFENEMTKLMNAFDRRNGNCILSNYLKRFIKICGC